MSAAGLQHKYSGIIEAAIAKVKVSGERVGVEAEDGCEAYAYPKPGRDIAWGLNSADFNLLRGVRRPDGKDVAVS
jgi:hypothetical protein